MLDLKEFRERKKKPEKINLKSFVQASVEADRLTSDPAWDYYLSILQSLLNQAKAAKQYNVDSLSDDVFGHVELLQAKSSLNRCDERIRILEMVMKLPRQIKSMGQEALKRSH